ncbi:unnamed protein product [Closterium sp. NIES-54]
MGYAAHQLNLWPRVSLPETSPTLRWTGKVGDASVFRVWGYLAFVCDTSADKLSARAIPCVFLGFYQPTSCGVFPSHDVTFDKPVPFYHLFPYRSAPLPPPPLFLAPGSPPVVVGSGGAQGAASGGAEPGVAESEGAGSGGAEPGGEEPGGAERAGVEPGGAGSEGVEPRGPAGASPRLSPQELREWLIWRAHLRSGATAGVGGTGGTVATGPEGARTRGTRAAETGGVGGARDGDHTKPRAAGAGGFGPGGAGVGGANVGGAGVLGVPSSTSLTPPLLCPPPDQLQLQLEPASPLPAPSAYTEQSGSLTERREPASRPLSPVRPARRVPRSRPPLVPNTHAMELHPSSVPLCVSLPAPPESSLPEVPDPESDRARGTSPTVSRLLATVVTDPSFECAAASALVAELL